MEQDVIRLDKARSFSELLTAVFDVIKQIARPLLRILFVNAGPFVALGALLFSVAFATLLKNSQSGMLGTSGSYSDMLGSLLENLVLWAVSIPVLTFATMVIYIISQSYVITYQQLGRIPTDDEAREGRKGAWGTALKLIGIAYVGVVVIAFLIFFTAWSSAGFLFLIIPITVTITIWAMIPLWITFTACRAGGLPVIVGIRYCVQLVKGHWWFCLGTFIVISLVQGLLGSVTQILQAIVLFAVMLSGIEGGETSEVGKYAVAATYGLNIFVSAFLGAITSIAAVVTYYSLVERREARSISDAIDQLGQQ